MNIYQKIAFGTVAILVVAYLCVWTTDLSGLGFLISMAGIVALLCLKTTWKVIFTITQFFGLALGMVGLIIGHIGDLTADKSYQLKSRIGSVPATTNGVPDWSSLGSHPDHDELDVPPFMKSVLDTQNA
jgi:hypothetical protein